MSAHIRMRLHIVHNHLAAIQRQNPACLRNCYSIQDNGVEVPGMGALNTSMAFCEDCADTISVVTDVYDTCGVGLASHCSHCGRPVYFLVNDTWTHDTLAAYKEGLLPDRMTTSEDLYALELALERLVDHLPFSENTDELSSFLSLVEDSLAIYHFSHRFSRRRRLALAPLIQY